MPCGRQRFLRDPARRTNRDGLAAGLFAATAQATAVALAGPEHRAKAVATVVGGTTFAVALGAPLASLVGHLAGWRSAYLVVAALALICLIVLWSACRTACPACA